MKDWVESCLDDRVCLCLGISLKYVEHSKLNVGLRGRLSPM